MSNSIQDICTNLIEKVLKITTNEEIVKLHELEEGFEKIATVQKAKRIQHVI